MPISTTTPNQPKILKIIVTGGVVGQPITIRNRTTGDEVSITLGATAKAQYDLQNLENGYTAGDVIDLIVSGEKMGQTSVTTAGTAPQTVTFTPTAITSGVSRGF